MVSTARLWSRSPRFGSCYLPPHLWVHVCHSILFGVRRILKNPFASTVPKSTLSFWDKHYDSPVLFSSLSFSNANSLKVLSSYLVIFSSLSTKHHFQNLSLLESFERKSSVEILISEIQTAKETSWFENVGLEQELRTMIGAHFSFLSLNQGTDILFIYF